MLSFAQNLIDIKKEVTKLLVDHEKIQEAKEKLGENNAFIMAEELKLEDFDTINLKSCCCFHEEDTPSLIYNPKNYTFHCFGCQKTVDIIDVFMGKGYSYLEAVKKLFELAEIKYSFGEHGVKTKRDYIYPKREPDHDKTHVYDYLGKRKITPATIDLCDVQEDANQNIVFNYYDTNDVLTMVKYRPARKIRKEKKEAKCWCQQNADTAHLLFNMNRVNAENPLLICEGEIDCLSAIEAGFHNAVSVPLGAGNTHWISENWEWLEQFSSIIICSDNDEAGLKLQKEAIYRLGTWRTKIIDIPRFFTKEDGTDIPVKDLNEVLYWMGKEEVMRLIAEAKDTPVDSVSDFSDIKEIDLSEIDGLNFGIEELDKELMRIFYGTFTIVTGVNGAGKSSFLSQIICSALDQKENAWLYSKELPNYMSKSWIDYILAGPRNVKEYQTNTGSVYYRVPQLIKDKIDDYYRGRLYIYKDAWPNTVEDILKSMEDCARKYGVKLFVVDNLTAVNLQANENNKWDKQAEFVTNLISFAQKFHVAVILVIHPKKIETMRRLCKMDIQGSGDMLNLAHRSLSLYRVTPKEKEGTPKTVGKGWMKEPIKFDVIVDVLKDRMRGRENLSVGLHYDIPSRRFFSNPKEYNHQYAWDSNTYAAPLPYPIYDDTDEVFGAVNGGD